MLPLCLPFCQLRIDFKCQIRYTINVVSFN